MSHNFFTAPLPKGVNLGGWLSQYPSLEATHLDHFITAADIRRIADWGMNHVRLPIDYPVLEADARPGHYLESGFERIEACLDWCAENGLSLALDMHHAPGYSFIETLEGDNGNQLFHSESAQQRFLALWTAIAQRFRNRYPLVAFETLNEVVLPDSEPWNELYPRVVAAIRAIDADRPLIVGSNRYGAIDTLAELRLDPDPNLVYTFHCYEPLMFTHQRAHWAPATRTHAAVVDYPGEIAGLAELVEAHPDFAAQCGPQIGIRMDADYLRNLIAPALAFRARSKAPLYCGEFGVIELAPAASRRAWLADFISLLNEHDIGRALWSYKQMDFGLVDLAGREIDPEYTRIACR